MSAADSHSQANVGRDSAAATAAIDEIAAITHDAGATVEVIIATAWDCPFDGPTPPDRVMRIVEAAVNAGADRIAIADTIGTTTPGRVTALLDQVRPAIGALPLGCHFHNTRGTGLASAYAAVLAGVNRLDASVGGLGGCPFAPVPAETSRPRTSYTCSATATSRWMWIWNKPFRRRHSPSG